MIDALEGVFQEVGGRTIEVTNREYQLRGSIRTESVDDLSALVIGRGAMLIAIGLSLGVIAAIALTRMLAGALYDVSPTDPTTFIVISLLLATVTLIACYLPARRAMKVDPLVALRYE